MSIRTITIILGTVALLTVFLIYNWRQNSVQQWNEQACTAFKMALEEDLHSRSDIKIKYSESPRKTLSLEIQVPKSVFIISEFGRREYKIDSCKHVHNITPDSRMRMIIGAVLDKRPLIPDTIDAIWQRQLKKEQIAAQTKVRVSVTDLEECTTSKSSTTFGAAVCDSLLSCYIGYRCEVEVTGFIKYAWFENISIVDGFFFSLPLFVVFLLYLIGLAFKNRLKKLFVKEVHVIVEKEIPVIVVEQQQSSIYRIKEGVYFDFENSLLRTDDLEEHLFPQSKLLLMAFLEAENYCLSSEEIMSLLWPKGNGTGDKVYQSITRLRTSLANVSSIILVNENCAYQLKIPDSIESN